MLTYTKPDYKKLLSDADFQAEALRISKSTAKLTQDARTPDKPDIIIDHFKHADKKRI
jgi:hypothetical protein